MKTIHVIFNAHIDPVWLWPWQAGLGEVVATCRSACDRIDAHPDIKFTRGEAWAYEQVERTDPGLFSRICEHIKAGRWEIVGGWYIQPDCNIPSYWAMERQIGIGKRYFEERFGTFPHIAYNVDSFGHSAALPGLLRGAGQDCYVYTRPNEQEMPQQPGRIFRWRGYTDGPEVIVCRPPTYSAPLTMDEVNKSVRDLPEGCEHAVHFLGVGDHGGGPTEEQIAWVREHAGDVEGWRMEFSTLGRFFDAIRPMFPSLPLFVGELYNHAIGCYSAGRAFKSHLRRAEQRLAQAESLGKWDSETRTALEHGWRRVCFLHFHDAICGCSIPSAYVTAHDQLGEAATAADDALHYHLRRAINALPDDPLQRIVLLNASETVFDDYVYYEAYVGPWEKRWQKDCALVDELGERVEFQLLDMEAVLNLPRDSTPHPHFLFRFRMEPGEMRTLRMVRVADIPPLTAGAFAKTNGAIVNNLGLKCGVDRVEWTAGDGPEVLPLQLHLIRDMSDTWSHSITSYDEEPVATPRWGDPEIVDRGPLMASLIMEGSIGRSDLRAEWRLFAGQPFAELRLRVHWREQFRILKLVLPWHSESGEGLDGIMGGSLVRPLDARERPLRDWTLLSRNDGRQMGVVCPDLYAIDGTRDRVRLTLLRSPAMAQHDQSPPSRARSEFSDQGVHFFRFRFLHGTGITAELLEAHATALQRPPVIAETTSGMPATV